MRLSEFEQSIILKVIRDIDPNAEIRLFGSRIDDDKKGGDIDLLVISDKLTFRDKITITGRLKNYLGERKIDVIVTKELSTAFLKVAHKNSIALYEP